jgi:hypothetical protein
VNPDLILTLLCFFTDKENVSPEENEMLEPTFFEKELKMQFLNLTLQELMVSLLCFIMKNSRKL